MTLVAVAVAVAAAAVVVATAQRVAAEAAAETVATADDTTTASASTADTTTVETMAVVATTAVTVTTAEDLVARRFASCDPQLHLLTLSHSLAVCTLGWLVDAHRPLCCNKATNHSANNNSSHSSQPAASGCSTAAPKTFVCQIAFNFQLNITQPVHSPGQPSTPRSVRSDRPTRVSTY